MTAHPEQPLTEAEMLDEAATRLEAMAALYAKGWPMRHSVLSQMAEAMRFGAIDHKFSDCPARMDGQRCRLSRDARVLLGLSEVTSELPR
jgi:hypothetical protein